MTCAFKRSVCACPLKQKKKKKIRCIKFDGIYSTNICIQIFAMHVCFWNDRSMHDKTKWTGWLSILVNGGRKIGKFPAAGPFSHPPPPPPPHTHPCKYIYVYYLYIDALFIWRLLLFCFLLSPLASLLCTSSTRAIVANLDMHAMFAFVVYDKFLYSCLQNMSVVWRQRWECLVKSIGGGDGKYMYTYIYIYVWCYHCH